MTPEEAKDMHALAIGAVPVASAGNALSVAIDALEILNRRPRPLCRDCGDEYGTCPTSGLPCDMRAVIRNARAAALASQSTPVAPVVEQVREVDEETAMQGGRWVSADDIERMVGELVSKATGQPFRPTKMVDGYRTLAAALAQSTPHVPAGEPSDTERLAWLHSTNKDAEGYEYGVMKVRWGAVGETPSVLWCASDHSDIDPMVIAARATLRAPEPAAPVAQEPVAEVYRGGTKQFGFVSVFKRWLPAADNLGEGTYLLYAVPRDAQGLSDAEKYQWLCEQVRNGPLVVATSDGYSLKSWSGEDLDRAILSANRAAQETK